MEENIIINQKDLIIGTEINAKIKTADIVLTNNNEMITIYLDFGWDGYGQGLPLYNLESSQFKNWVHNIMKVLEVSNWSEVQGKYCRIIRDKDDALGNIIGIKNIINNKQFMFNTNSEEIEKILIK